MTADRSTPDYAILLLGRRLARPIRFRIFAPLLSARGMLTSFARAGLASFFGVALAFPPLAAFWPLVSPALLLAGAFLRGRLLRRDVRALFRDGSGFVVGFCVRHIDFSSYPFFLRLVGA
jgi:hypothetical protein